MELLTQIVNMSWLFEMYYNLKLRVMPLSSLCSAKINETDTFGPGDDDEIMFDDIGDDDEDIDDVSI